MGASLVPYLRHCLIDRFPTLFFSCDESWLQTGLPMQNQKKRFGLQQAFSMSLLRRYLFCPCTDVGQFTSLGAILGPLLGDVHRYGFDMAFCCSIFGFTAWYVERGFSAARP